MRGATVVDNDERIRKAVDPMKSNWKKKNKFHFSSIPCAATFSLNRFDELRRTKSLSTTYEIRKTSANLHIPYIIYLYTTILFGIRCE